MNDPVGKADMIQGSFTTFAADRFNNPNSALNLNGGYTQVPSGVYFKSAFTITLWINAQNISTWCRLLDFGNAWRVYNIKLAFYQDETKPCLYISDVNSWKYFPISSTVLTLNTWSFLAATFSGTSAHIYINGIETALTTGSLFMPDNVLRTYGYKGLATMIGKNFEFLKNY